MGACNLEKELIKEPRLCHLALRLSEEALHVMIYNPIEDNSLIYRKISFGNAVLTQLKAFEEAVYDNPVLLSDFKHIDIIVDTPHYVIVPTELAEDTQLVDTIVAKSLPEVDGDVIECPIDAQKATLLMVLDTNLVGFMRRTFNNPGISHNLVPLCKYFYYKHRWNNTGRMFANLGSKRLDLIVFGSDRLRMANSFTYRDPMDAAYYILSCRNSLGLDAETDEMLLAGDCKSRDILTPILRKYLGYVMPEVFPSTMFKAGKDAMLAPFDLIVIPLCE